MSKLTFTDEHGEYMILNVYDGKTINLGVFKIDEFDLAVQARRNAEIQYFGEFRRNI